LNGDPAITISSFEWRRCEFEIGGIRIHLPEIPRFAMSVREQSARGIRVISGGGWKWRGENLREEMGYASYLSGIERERFCSVRFQPIVLRCSRPARDTLSFRALLILKREKSFSVAIALSPDESSFLCSMAEHISSNLMLVDDFR
jgi:hypothetical protein